MKLIKKGCDTNGQFSFLFKFTEKSFIYIKLQKEKRCIIMKANMSKIKCILSCFMTVIILFANSATFISSAYGANIGIFNSCMVYIRNINSGKYIDVQGGTVSNGKEVQLYEGVSSVAQRWNVVEESDGYYTIRSAVNQRYFLSVKGDKDVNGAKIVLKYVAAGSTVPDSTKFFFLETDYGCSCIVSKLVFGSGNTELHVLDAQQAGTANGTKLLSYTARDTLDTAAHQLWVFECDDRFPCADQEWDLVDLTDHCDWDGSSKYMGMVSKAANAWNTYIGDDVLRPDAWNRVQDVYIKDVDTDPEHNDAFGKTYPKTYHDGLDFSRASTIELYLDQMENFESNLQRQKVVTHELGHALGLYEFHPNMGNIMCQGPFAYGTSLGLDDKAQFTKIYATY